jgi:hypothetical protein
LVVKFFIEFARSLLNFSENTVSDNFYKISIFYSPI